jgi:hypothetical protein
MPAVTDHSSVGWMMALANSAFEVDGVVSGPWMKSMPA